MNKKPKDQKAYLTEEQVLLYRSAERIGESTAAFVDRLWTYKKIAAYQHIRDLLRLGDKYSNERLEAACARALFYGKESKEIVKYLLNTRLDQLSLNKDTDIFGQMMLKL